MIVPVGTQGVAGARSHNSIDPSSIVTGSSESLLQARHARLIAVAVEWKAKATDDNATTTTIAMMMPIAVRVSRPDERVRCADARRESSVSVPLRVNVGG